MYRMSITLRCHEPIVTNKSRPLRPLDQPHLLLLPTFGPLARRQPTRRCGAPCWRRRCRGRSAWSIRWWPFGCMAQRLSPPAWPTMRNT